jgi:hypothetical protein
VSVLLDTGWGIATLTLAGCVIVAGAWLLAVSVLLLLAAYAVRGVFKVSGR